jgi:hypothetical protein
MGETNLPHAQRPFPWQFDRALVRLTSEKMGTNVATALSKKTSTLDNIPHHSL